MENNKSRNASYWSVSKPLQMEVRNTKLLPLVLCGCEMCSLTFRQEHTLQMFKNKVVPVLN